MAVAGTVSNGDLDVPTSARTCALSSVSGMKPPMALINQTTRRGESSHG